MDNQNKEISIFAPHYESPENTTFITKIGGTTYEVSTYFNSKGKESILQQFMELLSNQKIA